MVESGQQAYELRHCSQEDQNMEYLMGAAPNIKSARLKPLRHSCLIDQLCSGGKGYLGSVKTYGIDGGS